MPEKMYNTRKVSKLLDISERTVRYWISTGKIHAVKYSGSHRWHVPEAEIERIAKGEAPKC